MTDPTIALKEHLNKHGLEQERDFLREGLELLSQLLIEAEAEEHIGAGRRQRSGGRVRSGGTASGGAAGRRG